MPDFASAAAKAATVPFPSPSIDASFRPAKALIGWMEPEQAHEVLALGHDGGVTPSIIGRAADARRSVQAMQPRQLARPAGPMSDDLAAHLTAVRAVVQADLDAGWRFASVALQDLVALQPRTFTDHYLDKNYDLSPTDAAEIAAITLPLPDDQQPLVQADGSGHSW